MAARAQKPITEPCSWNKHLLLLLPVPGTNTCCYCSSDTTIKTWNCLSNGRGTRTLHQHSDYVTCLAAAEKNSNVIASGGLGGEVLIWGLEAAAVLISKSTDLMEDDGPNGIIGSSNYGFIVANARSISSSSSLPLHTSQSHGHAPIAAKGHKDSVYALAMNESSTVLVSGGTEKMNSSLILNATMPPCQVTAFSFEETTSRGTSLNQHKQILKEGENQSNEVGNWKGL